MTACDECLRRGLLLRELAGHIDRSVERGAGRRARELLALEDDSLARAVGAGGFAASVASGGSGTTIERLREQLRGHGCWAVCRHDEGWPQALGRLGAAAPRALFGRGEQARLRVLAEAPAVTVVGARRAGPYGIEVASAIAEELAAAGLSVISGLAFGIDTAAHRGALAAGGHTVAVLGSGPERAYPRSRARLYREICATGIVLSELPPGSATFRWTFPARNRLMAALAGITVVVEAAERSGSLITAEMAADCGGAVGAVPGPVNSWRSGGTNALLADGAIVVRDGRDVLDRLLGPGHRPEPRSGRPLDPEESAVLAAVAGGAAGADAVARACGLAAAEAAGALARLELAGYVRLGFGGSCRRTRLRAPDPRVGANTMGR